MALHCNYYTSQTDFSSEPRIRVYSYESYPSRERRAEDRERYPNVYKIFNNRPSLGDTSVGARYMSPAHPEAVESVNYEDTRGVSQRPISSCPQVGIQTHVLPEKGKFAGHGSKAPFPSQHHVVTHPKAYPKMVESMQYGDTDWASQRPHSPPPHEGIQTRVPREKGMFVGNKSQAKEPSGRVSQRALSPQPSVPREKAKFVGHEEKSGRNDKKQEGDVGEEQCVDAAAAGFIEWKRRTLQMCKNFGD